MKKVRVFAPASIANLGCGFDIMGLALDEVGDILEMTASEGDGITITNQTDVPLPEDIEDPTDESTPTLSLSNAAGEYMDEMLMEGDLMVVSVYDPGKLRPQQWEKIENLMRNAAGLGFTPMVLAAATPESWEETVSSPGILSATYFADRKKLLTLNRSNGGASYIQDGLIVKKWDNRRLPGEDTLAELAEVEVTESLLSENNGDRVKFQGFLLYVFAVMLLL